MSNVPCGLDGVLYDKLKLRLFGTEIRAIGGQIPDVCELVNSLVNQFYGAAPNMLAMLGVLECFMKAKAAMDSVPDSILNLDPGALIEALGEVATCFTTNILPLLPNMSLPFAILDLIGLLISVLDCVESRLLMLSSILAQSSRIKLDATEAGSQLLMDIGLCMDDDNTYVGEGMTEGILGPVGVLFQILGLLMEILMTFLGGEALLRAALGLDEDDYLPDFGNVMGDMSGRGVGYIISFIGSLRRDILIPIYEKAGVKIGL